MPCREACAGLAVFDEIAVAGHRRVLRFWILWAGCLSRSYQSDPRASKNFWIVRL